MPSCIALACSIITCYLAHFIHCFTWNYALISCFVLFSHIFGVFLLKNAPQNQCFTWNIMTIIVSNKARYAKPQQKKNSSQPLVPRGCRFLYPFMSINSLGMRIGKESARTRNHTLFIFRRTKCVILALFALIFLSFRPLFWRLCPLWSGNRPFRCESKQSVCFTWNIWKASRFESVRRFFLSDAI